MARITVPGGMNWTPIPLNRAIRRAESGDTIVVPSESIKSMGILAHRRMCPEKDLTFEVEAKAPKSSGGIMETNEHIKIFDCWLIPDSQDANEAKENLENSYSNWIADHKRGDLYFSIVDRIVTLDGAHYVITIIYRGLSENELSQILD